MISVRGHAALAPAKCDPEGAIVCAAVSAIVQTAILGLRAVGESHPDRVVVDLDDQRVHSAPAADRGF